MTCNRLSHDVVTSDVDHNVATSYCKSSSDSKGGWIDAALYTFMLNCDFLVFDIVDRCFFVTTVFNARNNYFL